MTARSRHPRYSPRAWHWLALLAALAAIAWWTEYLTMR